MCGLSKQPMLEFLYETLKLLIQRWSYFNLIVYKL